jgi:excisionase family DNA binding protein
MVRLGKRGSNPGGILSTQEVARVLEISYPTLLKLLRTKQIPEPQQLSGSRRWGRADVQHARLVVEELVRQGDLRRKGGAR